MSNKRTREKRRRWMRAAFLRWMLPSMPIVVDPAMPDGEIRFEEVATGRVLGRITGVTFDRDILPPSGNPDRE